MGTGPGAGLPWAFLTLAFPWHSQQDSKEAHAGLPCGPGPGAQYKQGHCAPPASPSALGELEFFSEYGPPCLKWQAMTLSELFLEKLKVDKGFDNIGEGEKMGCCFNFGSLIGLLAEHLNKIVAG